jgi:hypothetical protein
MSKLVDRAIEGAGLAGVLSARAEGEPLDAYRGRLEAADLLVLGAIADRVRAAEVGPEVRIHTNERESENEGDGAGVVVLPEEGDDKTGLELLRAVAIARITGPSAARVRVDWTRCGLELAQVALGFGADELVGFIATKRGLPIAEGEMLGVGKKSKRELAQVVKRKELAACVERGGRTPVFVGVFVGEGDAAAIGATGTAVEPADGAGEGMTPFQEAL